MSHAVLINSNSSEASSQQMMAVIKTMDNYSMKMPYTVQCNDISIRLQVGDTSTNEEVHLHLQVPLETTQQHSTSAMS